MDGYVKLKKKVLFLIYCVFITLKLRIPTFTMNMFILLIACMEVVRAQEVATPSSLLKPRNYNYHAAKARQYLDNLNKLLGPVPTRKGPVLFPPSPSEPPATPLIVTSRPLSESIARSDYNKNLTSNIITDQSQVNAVKFQPNYFAQLTQYKPVTLPTLQPDTYTLSPRIGSNILDDYAYDQVPYTDIAKKSIGNKFGVDKYNEFETRTALPPIYNALSQNSQQKVQSTQQDYPIYDYQSKQRIQQNNNNDISDEGNNLENAEDKSYAFSYAVKDQKTGDDFSHSQRSSGSATNGEYRVKLPDGRLQIVSYTADENGYNADVRYDVDTSANSVEYNKYDVNQNVNNQRDYNDYKPSVNNAPLDNDNAKLYTDYQAPTKVDYTDVSKEYYNDYSSEYNKNYEPHQSKFAALFEDKTNALTNLDLNQYLTSTVKPNYLQLEDVLTKALPNVQPTFNYHPRQETTEKVVLIGGRNTFKSDPSDSSISSFIDSTPRNYLVSTIASLRDRVSSKPILSDSFINRINKYLSFN